MVNIHAAIKAADAEPDVRRAYRRVGARQCLAHQANAGDRAERQHLARAAVVAVMILLTLAALFVFASDLRAEPAAPRRVVVLVDLTKSVTPENFQANVQGVAATLNRLGGGDHVTILGITDSFGHPRVLLDRTLPVAGYLGLELHAGRELLAAGWRHVASAITPTYRHTDILGSLMLAACLDGRDPPTDVIVFSDLRQSSAVLNIEGLPQIDLAQSIPRLQRAHAIPTLTNARVFLLGVDPTGVTATYYTSLHAFWLRAFHDVGADVKQFSVGRELAGF